MSYRAVFFALLSSALFGISTPAAKALLSAVDPEVLAGLFYCGAGMGVALLRHLLLPLIFSNVMSEASLGPRDWPWLGGAIAAGGVAGPILLMIGLISTDAATASLLLTLEGVATALLAWFVFNENFDRRIALGMACIIAGAVVLSWAGAPTLAGALGPLAISGACLAWGLDNNLTRKVSLSDPLQIVEWKGLTAGPFNLGLGLWVGTPVAFGGAWLLAGVIGFLGYGLSLVLYVIALRHLGGGARRCLLCDRPFRRRSDLSHRARRSYHGRACAVGCSYGNRLHIHYEHHRHEHGPDDPPGEPHTHRHRHEPLALGCT
jgi:drug/metabolite transporter (DMT)-like permease